MSNWFFTKVQSPIVSEKRLKFFKSNFWLLEGSCELRTGYIKTIVSKKASHLLPQVQVETKWQSDKEVFQCTLQNPVHYWPQEILQFIISRSFLVKCHSGPYSRILSNGFLLLGELFFSFSTRSGTYVSKVLAELKFCLFANIKTACLYSDSP